MDRWIPLCEGVGVLDDMIVLKDTAESKQSDFICCLLSLMKRMYHSPGLIQEKYYSYAKGAVTSS
jgi:hypothetical protein